MSDTNTHFFQTLTEHNPDSILVIRSDGQFKYMNLAAKKLLGIEAGSIPHKFSICDFDVRHSTPEKFRSFFEFMKFNSPSIQFTKLKNQGGTEIDIEMNAQIIQMEGEEVLTSQIRDIRDRLQLEENRIRNEVEKKRIQIKKNFLNTVSHELRTPLNGILGLLSVFPEENLESEQIDYLKIIHTSSNRLSEVLNDILNLAKLESGRNELIKSTFNLSESIHKIRQLFEVNANINNNQIILDSIDPRDKVRTDRSKFEHVLSNLMSNALKFTQGGFVIIRAYKAQGSDSLIRIEVEDNGIGMTQDNLELIFERFTQIDTEEDRQYEGLGIGLSLCQELVKLLGGTIDVKSEIGQGSTFSFTFLSDDTQKVEVKRGKHLIDPEWKNRKRVLIADDNFSNRRVLEVFLDRMGYTCDSTNSGEQLLDHFQPDQYAFVIIDITMPKLNGIDTLKELQKRYETLPPVLAHTAIILRNEQSSLLDEGFDYFINKPATVAELKEFIYKFEGN